MIVTNVCVFESQPSDSYECVCVCVCRAVVRGEGGQGGGGGGGGGGQSLFQDLDQYYNYHSQF